jgi:Anti-sigma factor NepR
VIGRALQLMYSDLVLEPLPTRMLLLLAQLDGAYPVQVSATCGPASPDAQDRLV